MNQRVSACWRPDAGGPAAPYWKRPALDPRRANHYGARPIPVFAEPAVKTGPQLPRRAGLLTLGAVALGLYAFYHGGAEHPAQHGEGAAGAGGAALSIEVHVEDGVLPERYRAQIDAGTRRIYAQWRAWLGDAASASPPVNLRFVGNGERFTALWGKGAGADWTPTGFYRLRNNEAVVLYTPAYRDHALANAFHEISHLVTAWHLGASPPWLNEGIAEYFETMSFETMSFENGAVENEAVENGSAENGYFASTCFESTYFASTCFKNTEIAGERARFKPSRAHLDLLRAQGPVPLDELLGIAGRDWTAEAPHRRYASAWSLIAFLMDSGPGRETLQALVRQAHAQRRAPAADLAPLLATYPGGRKALEAAWRRWVFRD